MSILDDLAGAGRLPGGCDDCDAYTTLDLDDDGIYRMLVHHDDTCPWLTERDRPRSTP